MDSTYVFKDLGKKRHNVMIIGFGWILDSGPMHSAKVDHN